MDMAWNILQQNVDFRKRVISWYLHWMLTIVTFMLCLFMAVTLGSGASIEQLLVGIAIDNYILLPPMLVEEVIFSEASVCLSVFLRSTG